MVSAKADATAALVTVVKALEPLESADRNWVIQSVAAKWSLQFRYVGGTEALQSAQGGGLGVPASNGLPSTEPSASHKDVRGFIRAKQPTTDVQKVACLVFYLTKTTNKVGFTAKEIAKAHTDSGMTKFNMTRALDNATRQSKYLTARDRREKQLTNLGEDVVEALPDQAKVKAVEASTKARGSKRKAKRAKKSKKA